jgi:hypothetical protein
VVTLPEHAFYQFVYRDGPPACFADIEIWAELKGGTGAKILVFGGNGRLQTNGAGLLPRIARDRNWVDPEVRLFDFVAGRGKTFPLHAWNYALDWDRPAPFAEAGAQQFTDVDKFLNFLVTVYRSLSSSTPSRLKFRLNRVGSPPINTKASVIFVQLQEAMNKANGNFLLDPNAPDINQEFEDERLLPGRRMLWALSGLIPVGARTSGRHTVDSMAAAYLQMLQRVSSADTSLRLDKILKAMSHALPHGLSKDDGVINELEDWALAGLLIFVAGLNAFRYVFESFDEPDDPMMQILSITMVLAKP